MSATVLDPRVQEPGVLEPSPTRAMPKLAPPASPLGKPQDFRYWLESLPLEQSCGQQCEVTRCPLATYLRARHSTLSDIYVMPGHYNVGRQSYVMPRWAQLFVTHTDALRPFGGLFISAGQALHYLDQALEAERHQESGEVVNLCV